MSDDEGRHEGREGSLCLSLRGAASKISDPAGNPFVELFEHGSLAVELYSPRGEDLQQPHTRDEVYVVARGHGEFVHGERRDPFGPGDLLFVPAGLEHRFVDFSEDLLVWVMFYGPEGGEQPSSSS